MENGFFEYNNGRLYFESYGDGEPLLFIHGFTLDHRMWETQVEFLKTQYKVYTYDMRGFGLSSVPVGRYRHHEDIKALSEFLQIKKAHIIGLSLGGEVAIDLCLEYPSLVKSLALVDSSLSGYTSTVDWNLHGKEQGIEQGKKNWLNHEVFTPTRKNAYALSLIQEIVNDYSGWHLINNDPRVKILPSPVRRLHEIKVPTITIVGEHDLSYFHDISKILHSDIHGSELKIIKNAGHMVNLEQPSAFNNTLSDFLKKVKDSKS